MFKILRKDYISIYYNRDDLKIIYVFYRSTKRIKGNAQYNESRKKT